MNRDDARIEIRKHWKDLFPADKSGKGIICPICGNGSGADGTGIRENTNAKKPGSLKCFKCGFYGDLIDIIKADRGLDFNEALDFAAKRLGITIDKSANASVKRDRSAQDRVLEQDRAVIPPTGKDAENALKTPQTDFTDYYKACIARIEDPAAVAYLEARGISLETAKCANLGFDPVADPAQSGHTCPRIIIPVTRSHFVARSIDPNTPKDYAKLNNKGAKPGIFNLAAVWGDTDAVFVVEGAFDALAIIEAGAAAIALNSTGNAQKLIKQLEERKTKAILILALDNDSAGHNATPILQQGLQRLGISYIVANICGRAKDPNAAMTGNRQGFFNAVKCAQDRALANK